MNTSIFLFFICIWILCFVFFHFSESTCFLADSVLTQYIHYNLINQQKNNLWYEKLNYNIFSEFNLLPEKWIKGLLKAFCIIFYLYHWYCILIVENEYFFGFFFYLLDFFLIFFLYDYKFISQLKDTCYR